MWKDGIFYIIDAEDKVGGIYDYRAVITSSITFVQNWFESVPIREVRRSAGDIEERHFGAKPNYSVIRSLLLEMATSYITHNVPMLLHKDLVYKWHTAICLRKTNKKFQVKKLEYQENATRGPAMPSLIPWARTHTNSISPSFVLDTSKIEIEIPWPDWSSTC